MSSSNRESVDCDGVLKRHGETAGPIVLPEIDGVQFIEQFNRIYGRIGLRIEAVEQEKVDEEVAQSPPTDPQPSSA